MVQENMKIITNKTVERHVVKICHLKYLNERKCPKNDKFIKCGNF